MKRLALLFLLVACSSNKPADTTPESPKVGGMPADGDDAECLAAGGACKGIGDCGPGAGHMATPTCGATHLVCCVPEGSCGGAEDFSCCAGDTRFRPACSNGALVCADGQEKCSQ